MTRFNEWLAVKLTNTVGTMWTAYLFGLLALLGLPVLGIPPAIAFIIVWFCTAFLQLVFLPILAVGQNIQGREQARLLQETHDAVVGRLDEVHATVTATHNHVKGL